MRLLLLTILLFINSISFSQLNTINLKSGQHEIEYNFDILSQNEKYYRYVLFSEIPSTEQITISHPKGDSESKTISKI